MGRPKSKEDGVLVVVEEMEEEEVMGEEVMVAAVAAVAVVVVVMAAVVNGYKKIYTPFTIYDFWGIINKRNVGFAYHFR